MKRGFVVLMMLMLMLSVAGVAAAEVKKPAVARTVYSQMDANGDNKISVTEHAAYWQGRFKEIDKDKDGKVTAAEFNAATKAFFGDMDQDKDGVLVAKEYIAFWCGPKALTPEKIKATPKKKLDANGNSIIEDDECIAFWMADLFDMDSNHDGKITSEEFMAAMAKRFKEIDRNRDGFISIEEHSYFYTGKPVAAK